MFGIIPFTHLLLKKAIQPGDFAIDCTVGNGHDTLYLANLVGSSGHVYGFDIQQTAISHTENRIKEHNLKERVTLYHCGHEQLQTVLPSRASNKIKAAIFNLGYLPKGDKTIVTQPTSTIKAIQSLLTVMPNDGLILLVVYHGHPEGKVEKEALLNYVYQLDQRTADVFKYQFINQINHPPFVIGIRKK